MFKLPSRAVLVDKDLAYFSRAYCDFPTMVARFWLRLVGSAWTN